MFTLSIDNIDINYSYCSKFDTVIYFLCSFEEKQFCDALQETFFSSKTASLLALEYLTNQQSFTKSSSAGCSIADPPATLSSGVFVHYLVHCPTQGLRQLQLKLLESLLKALFHKHMLSPVRTTYHSVPLVTVVVLRDNHYSYTG